MLPLPLHINIYIICCYHTTYDQRTKFKNHISIMKLHLQATPQVLQQTIWCKKQWHSYYSRLHELRFGQTQDKHISNQAVLMNAQYRPGEAYAQLFRFVIFSVAPKKHQHVKQTIVLLQKLSILTRIPSAYNATRNSKRGTTVCIIHSARNQFIVHVSKRTSGEYHLKRDEEY